MSARSMPSTFLRSEATDRPGPRGGPSRVEVIPGRVAGFRNEADQPSQGPALERRPGQARPGVTRMPALASWRTNGAQAGLRGPLPLESGTRRFRLRLQGTMAPQPDCNPEASGSNTARDSHQAGAGGASRLHRLVAVEYRGWCKVLADRQARGLKGQDRRDI